MGRFTDLLLGSSTSPLAGDGYGGAASFRPASSIQAKTPLKSPNQNLQIQTPQTDYFGPVNSIHSSAKSSRNPSPIPEDEQVDEVSLGSSSTISQPQDPRRTPRAPNGVRAPRCSVATMAAMTVPIESPRPSMESIHSANSAASRKSPASPVIQTPTTPDPVDDIPWEEYEIPQELEIVKEYTPEEIRNIVQESLDEHRAMRASRIQAQLTAWKSTARLKGEASNAPRNTERPSISESSSMASASTQSTPASDHTHNRSNSSLSVTHTSVASMESDREEVGLLKAPTRPSGSLSNVTSQDSLRSKRVLRTVPTESMTEMERRFMESKLRTRKGYKMFHLLPGRKLKDEPSPDFLKREFEAAVSECTGCFDDVPNKKAVEMPCHHKYCAPCFAELVRTGIQSEATFPPKCCLTEIPKKLMRQYLPPKALAQFEEKALEYAVPVANRFYCVSRSCGKWIDTRIARRTNGALECPHCAVKLCTVCRGPQHPASQECPQDFELDRTLEQAERAGWRRCNGCRAMVERNRGCRHITCRCGNEFCYTCGARWQTCPCTEADQQRRDIEIGERIAQYEADQRAEEEEMRAAVAAVRAAAEVIQREREAEEEREREEQREIERLERGRIENIAHYYGYLREVLERVRLMQQTAIEKRHDRAWDEIDKMRDDLESPEKATERERYVKEEREKISVKTENTIKALQRRHATSMMETITRHRRDQDDLLAMSIDITDEDTELVNAEKLAALMPAQDLERSTLKSQQAREIHKHRVRGEESLKAFDVKTKVLHMRLEEAETINQCERAMRDTVFADSKWFDLVFDERASMLMDDQKRMERSGADAPAGPKRDTVVFPGFSSSTPSNELPPHLAPKKDSLTPRGEPCFDWPSPKKDSLTPRAEVPSESMAEQLGIILSPPTGRNRDRSVSASKRDAPSISMLTRGDFPSPEVGLFDLPQVSTMKKLDFSPPTAPANSWAPALCTPAPRTRDRSLSTSTRDAPPNPLAAPKRIAPQIPTHDAMRRGNGPRPALPW